MSRPVSDSTSPVNTSEFEAGAQRTNGDEKRSKDDIAQPPTSNAEVHAETSTNPRQTCCKRSRNLHTLAWIAVFMLFAKPFMRKWLSGDQTSRQMPKLATGDDANGCVRYAAWQEGLDPQGRLHPDGFMNSARASFELPASSQLLYLISRGSPALVHGSIEIVTSGDVPPGAVHVDVSASYNHNHMFRHTKVCLLQPSKDEHGIGIFAPELFHPSPEQQVVYDIQVKLPSAQNDTRAHFKHLMTNLPVFTHRVGELANSTHFNSFTVRTANAKIDATGVSADHISIMTSNRPIQGSFESSSSICLHTTNAPIDVNVTLIHDEAAPLTRLDMMTSNGRLYANISAISNERYHIGGTFKTIAATTNAPMNLTFVKAPVDSVLLLDGRTTNGELVTRLPITYEGSFSVSNSASTVPEVLAQPNPPDPAGRGHTREVQVHRINGGTVEGDVSWQTPSRFFQLGWTKLTTSTAPLTLSL